MELDAVCGHIRANLLARLGRNGQPSPFPWEDMLNRHLAPSMEEGAGLFDPERVAAIVS